MRSKGPKNPYRKTCGFGYKGTVDNDPRYYRVERDTSGEPVVKNGRGVTVASGFDNDQEAFDYIAEKLK